MTRTPAFLALGACCSSLARRRAGADHLRVGLAEDPDVLDPTLARTFVGRIVFAALCDKLFDIDEKLTIVPQLATGYDWSADNKALTMKIRPGVTFHDGEKLDAAAVKFNLERHKTMAGLEPARRAGAGGERRRRRPDDGASSTSRAPFSPLLAALADRAGMMVSPEGRAGRGRQLRRQAGLLRARSSSSSASRRTASCSSATPATGTRPTSTSTRSSTRRSSTRPCAWPTCKSGQFDFIERVAPSRHREAARPTRSFKVTRITEIGYQGITINVGKSEQAQKNPLGKDPRVREAFELALDRAGPGPGGDGQRGDRRQPVGRAEQHLLRQEHAAAQARHRRAKALLKEAGVPEPERSR